MVHLLTYSELQQILRELVTKSIYSFTDLL